MRLNQQWLQRRGNWPRQQVHARVAGDGFRSPVPEHRLALRAEQRDALGNTVQRGFKQLRAIGHSSSSIFYIGTPRTNFTAS
jgi:hypothetical protein